MGKYDEFDLDIKQDKSLDIVNPNTCSYVILSCPTVIISIDWCEDISNMIDCFSRNMDCSGRISECSPCGSGYGGIARC